MNKVGLPRGMVSLEPYSLSWPKVYEVESNLIRDVIHIAPEDIQHVGSTSIPGMVAKPIIDIAVRIDSLDLAEAWKDKLADIGYWYKGIQPDMPDRRFFAKGPEDNRTVYLHMVNNEEFNRLIKFRTCLIKNKEAAIEYAELKQKLAMNNADNRANYSKLKHNFIQAILNK
jgi:GrpB-like predicted nucleotidyltransferase (UPF0157 family)